ncbi:MAG TPA: S-layer homology domain-containing protein, partial [Ureibacillus sp.]|nr:S-layer homology domain-containing protein [Ureibacillus sp.]
GHWAASFIEDATVAGIFKGFPDGSFKPAQQLKRVQMASIISRAFGLETTEKTPFTDIAKYDASIENEIAGLYVHNITKGTGNNKFSPEANITREELAVMVYRTYTDLTGKTYTAAAKTPFTDLNGVTAEAKTAISFLYENEVVNGVSATKFAPKAIVTRAEAAKIVLLTLDTVNQ